MVLELRRSETIHSHEATKALRTSMTSHMRRLEPPVFRFLDIFDKPSIEIERFGAGAFHRRSQFSKCKGIEGKTSLSWPEQHSHDSAGKVVANGTTQGTDPSG